MAHVKIKYAIGGNGQATIRCNIAGSFCPKRVTCAVVLGNWQWARGSNGFGQCEGWSGATDAQGNVYAIGEVLGGANTFGTTTLSDSSQEIVILYLLNYDAAGNLAWIKGIDTSRAFTYAITTDAASNIYVTGMFQGVSSAFGNYTLLNAETAGGTADIFIWRLGN